MSAATTSALPYVPLESFPTDAPATGGDSLTEDFNVYYQVSVYPGAIDRANVHDSRATLPGS